MLTNHRPKQAKRKTVKTFIYKLRMEPGTLRALKKAASARGIKTVGKMLMSDYDLWL